MTAQVISQGQSSKSNVDHRSGLCALAISPEDALIVSSRQVQLPPCLGITYKAADVGVASTYDIQEAQSAPFLLTV